jgi:serine/threonine-protein kinase
VQPSRVLRPVDFQSSRAKFIEEANTLKRFDHVGIVKVYSAFQENNTAYMVMEYLQGRSLEKMLHVRNAPLTEEEVLPSIQHVAQALEVMHKTGFLHRDIKPENIIVCDNGRVALIDFGTAREYSRNKVKGHTVMVTPGYAPLEQYAQHAVRGPYTDVYALAATLYHLLTGQLPVPASDRAMGVELKPARTLNPRISSEVARAIDKGLEIEIGRRPQSVYAFMKLLSRRLAATTAATGTGTARRFCDTQRCSDSGCTAVARAWLFHP